MMRWKHMHKLGRMMAIATLGSAVLVVANAGGALAAVGYGPPGPPPPPVPGGYSVVVTSQTVIGPAGGTIGPVNINGVAVTLTIPAGAFPVPVQITLTAPDLAAIGTAGFFGHSAVAGVGIQVQENGSPYPGTFLKPLTLTMSSSSITSSSIVVVWNGTAFVAESAATVTAGSATVSFDSDPDFAVLAPSGTGAIPGATTAATGKPFLGEGILAGLLLLLGATGLGYARRRRAVARAAERSRV
jgi:hypothetical protein